MAESEKQFVARIQAESKARFPGTGRKAKLARKAWRNEQRAALGLKPESKLARKGLAGVYDRNKKPLKAAVTIGAALVGGPAAAAAARAAMSGLDTGRKGITFDAGKAARGGLEGAAIGGATQLGAGALKAGVGALRSGSGVSAALKAAKTGALNTGTGRQLVKVGNTVRGALPTAASNTAGTAGTVAGTVAKAPMNWADMLQLGTSAVGAYQGIKNANAAGAEADRQFGTATRANDAALAMMPTIASRVGDRSGGPDLSSLDDLDNPYTRRRRAAAAGAPMIGAPRA
jgi:hypothetical protein